MPDDVAARDVDGVAPPAKAAPSAEVVAASALLEAVARERGVAVRRLDPETVLCDGGGRRMLFHGLAGGATSKLAQVLCGNDAWLRSHLARHGIPVVPTRLVPADDPLFAEEVARRLGFPVRLQLADPTDDTTPTTTARTAADVASFHESWRALTATLDDPRARVILEAVPTGRPVEVAVAGGEVVDTPTAGEAAAGILDLAVRAVAALPGLGYAVVEVVATGEGPAVSRVLPVLRPETSISHRFAMAVVDVELGNASRR